MSNQALAFNWYKASATILLTMVVHKHITSQVQVSLQVTTTSSKRSAPLPRHPGTARSRDVVAQSQEQGVQVESTVIILAIKL